MYEDHTETFRLAQPLCEGLGSHDGGEGGDSSSSSPQDEQPSNARLALIMGSLWVYYAGNTQLEA